MSSEESKQRDEAPKRRMNPKVASDSKLLRPPPRPKPQVELPFPPDLVIKETG